MSLDQIQAFLQGTETVKFRAEWDRAVPIVRGRFRPTPLPRAELGREAHDWRLRPEQIALNFQYYAMQALADGDECLA